FLLQNFREVLLDLEKTSNDNCAEYAGNRSLSDRTVNRDDRSYRLPRHSRHEWYSLRAPHTAFLERSNAESPAEFILFVSANTNSSHLNHSRSADSDSRRRIRLPIRIRSLPSGMEKGQSNDRLNPGPWEPTLEADGLDAPSVAPDNMGSVRAAVPLYGA